MKKFMLILVMMAAAAPLYAAQGDLATFGIALAAGLAIGVVGDAAVRANAQKDMIVGMILILIFAEALALYGFIIAIVVNLGG